MSEINETKELREDTFPINLKLTQEYQRLEPSIGDKYKIDTYRKSSFCGGSNIDLILITCKDSIVIPSKLQSYVITLVPYISPSYRNVKNGGDDLPTFVLA